MTISIKVSVNGNYKVPIRVTRSGSDLHEEQVISGRGHEGPNEVSIPFYHGTPNGTVNVTVGPEEEDKG